MSLDKIFTLIFIIIILALLQSSFFSFFGTKPLWVVAFVFPLIAISGSMGLNIFIVAVSALLLKSSYGLEIEILIFLAVSLLLFFVKSIWIKNFHVLIYGGISILSVGYFLVGGYEFWYEIMLTSLVALMFYYLLKRSGYENIRV